MLKLAAYLLKFLVRSIDMDTLEGRLVFSKRKELEGKAGVLVFGMLALPLELANAMSPTKGWNLRHIVGFDGTIVLTGNEPIIKMPEHTKSMRVDQLLVSGLMWHNGDFD